MYYYRITDPYGKSNQYYIDYYLVYERSQNERLLVTGSGMILLQINNGITRLSYLLLGNIVGK